MYSNRKGMLSQVIHWTEYAGAGIDLLLLLRVLGLRLQRTYVFITLVCVLTAFFDIVDLSLVRESPEWRRVVVYSELIFAFAFPVAAWDVFEELANSLNTVRRLAITRTVTSLLMISIFGLMLASLANSSEDPAGLAFISTVGIVVWTGSASGSLAFIWAVHRAVRLQKMEPPHNTFVWMIFFELFLGAQVLAILVSLVEASLGQTSTGLFPQIGDLVLNLYLMGITVWCTLKLKSLPRDLPSASLNENP
jgi:hypothetical protein